ncbi:glutaminase [Cytophaga aurantiaca]|uniref:glutaminase n=1 Tax=Cytophaga aurantiaca TaxID=29530 RepID=UPI0003A51295|nr:glutaminase [Cytophaga aurantiaca]
MNYQAILNQIQKDIKPYLGQGKVADYIPALAGIDPIKFGMSIHTVDGIHAHIGDAQENFSIQSISKILTLTMAIAANDAGIWKRVGREPSGSKFNSLIQLELEQGIPRNPFINAGAHVITDIICSHIREPKEAILEFVRMISMNDQIDFDYAVAQSERETGNRNLAMGYFMKSFGNIHNKVREVLDVYFHQCSLSMSCSDLSKAFLYLANEGVIPSSEKAIIPKKASDRINALMLTCGMYDSVGDFAYRVGLPSKSGVGGGIVSIVPGEMSIAVWSPGLSESGNSLAGTKALELFVNYTGKTIF